MSGCISPWMRMLPVLLLLVVACGTPEAPPAAPAAPVVAPAEPTPAEPPPPALPASPDGTTPDMKQRAEVVRALGVVREAASAHGWVAHIQEPFWDRVEVYDTQAALWSRILQLHGMPADTELPTDGLTAALEKRVLMAVDEQEYARIRPIYAAGREAWRRLLAHEIAHRLHVRVLDGDEDAMGPTWFFEGFATFIADQELGEVPPITSLEDALAAGQAKGDGAYAKYQSAVAWLAERVPLPELVAHAGDVDFEGWLKQRLEGAGD